MPATEQMSSADAAWLRMDRPTNLMVVTSALWFDEQLDWDRAREVLETRLVKRFARFRQRVVEDESALYGPRWEDDLNFDLDDHLNRVTLPEPGDQAQLQALVGELMATPLDRSKPLWRFELVDGYRGGSAIVARMHHCIADGVALARVMLSLTDEARDSGLGASDDGIAPPDGRRRGLRDVLPAPAADLLAAARGAAGTFAHEARVVARDPEKLLELAGAVRDGAEALAKLLLSEADPESPLKGELGVPQRAAWSDPIPLEDVRRKGHETGTTINDIVLTAMAGALRDYLRGRNGLVEELTALVPFNLRPLDEPLPAELGNRFGVVFLRLPVGVEDRARRWAEVHSRMEEIKRSPEGAVSYGVLEALGRAPVGIEKLAVELLTSKGTAVMTNVPGPRHPVYLAGAPVRGVLVWAPRSGSVSMSVAIFSYAGEITIGLMVDAGLIPDPEAILAAYERELVALLRSSPAGADKVEQLHN